MGAKIMLFKKDVYFSSKSLHFQFKSIHIRILLNRLTLEAKKKSTTLPKKTWNFLRERINFSTPTSFTPQNSSQQLFLKYTKKLKNESNHRTKWTKKGGKGLVEKNPSLFDNKTHLKKLAIFFSLDLYTQNVRIQCQINCCTKKPS